MTDLEIIDGLLVLLALKIGKPVAALETEYHITQEAMARLRLAWKNREAPITTAFIYHFEQTDP